MTDTKEDRAKYKLYEIQIKRVFTEDYVNKYNNGKPRTEHSTYTVWGSNFDTVEADAKLVHDVYPTKYVSFDKMYRESFIAAKEVSLENLTERRSWAARYSRCCELGIQRPCVCSYSITCPVHGTKCTGTHD